MSLTRHPMLRFIGLGALLYLAWHLLYEFILKPHTALDEVVATNLVDGTTWLLDLFGYEVMDAATCARPHALGIVGGDCLQVGAPCDGVVLFALFICFIAAFPGPWKMRLWYIPLGLALIHLSNLIRIASLVLILFYSPESLAFNHDYTFTIFVYAVIFALWYSWVGKSNLTPTPSDA